MDRWSRSLPLFSWNRKLQSYKRRPSERLRGPFSSPRPIVLVLLSMEDFLDDLSEDELGAEDSMLPHEKIILREKQNKAAWREAKPPADNEAVNLMGNMNGNTHKQQHKKERRASDTKTWTSEDEEEKYLREEWPQHEKHFFILSNVGRPIYSR